MVREGRQEAEQGGEARGAQPATAGARPERDSGARKDPGAGEAGADVGNHPGGTRVGEEAQHDPAARARQGEGGDQAGVGAVRAGWRVLSSHQCSL